VKGRVGWKEKMEGRKEGRNEDMKGRVRKEGRCERKGRKEGRNGRKEGRRKEEGRYERKGMEGRKM
jgi:hypothetical protein